MRWNAMRWCDWMPSVTARQADRHGASKLSALRCTKNSIDINTYQINQRQVGFSAARSTLPSQSSE
jgi:hypothetical protein